jgi:hypothetical protein
MTTPNITALLQQLSPVSRAGSAATGSFSLVSGHTGTYSRGGGATRVRLVRTDDHGSQSKCRHQIGTATGSSSEKCCFADRIEGAETCGTRHQGDEVALEADALYIRVSKTQILGRPFLPCTILAQLTMSISCWRRQRNLWTGKLRLQTSLGPQRTLAMPPSTPSFCFDGRTTFGCHFGPLGESGLD